MARAADTREAILAAAVELIWARSFHAVSVDDVCAAAGARKGSFYHFFPSKKELLLEIIERERRACVAFLFEPHARTRRGPHGRIGRVFDLLYRAHKTQSDAHGRMVGCLFGNLSLELSTQDDDIRLAVRAVFDEFTRYFGEALGGGARAAATGAQLVAYLEGVVLVAKTQDDPELIRRSRAGALALVRGAATATT